MATPKNIIVLSDGTGNAASSFWRTNVWRLFQSLDLHGSDQVAKYDDGVGTSSFVPLAIIGGAFGWGLKRNILDGYKFVCRNYAAGDKVFLFGFSRGAFTVRVLTALILQQGLVVANTEAELDDLAKRAYRAYRANGYHSYLRLERPLRSVRDFFVGIRDRIVGRRPYDASLNTPVPSIEFIGVWDTVAAYGLPADEMTRGWNNYIWPLELPNRVLDGRVRYARHALALDDERTTFHPVLWTEEDVVETEPSVDDHRLVQVWFAGMHANVGGGYPDDAVAHLPLLWMMQQAERRFLKFKKSPTNDPDAIKVVQSIEDKDGRLYDSRSGVGGYYRYGPRDVAALCDDPDNGVRVALSKIHASVFGRIDSGANAYAPIGLPANYVTLDGAGSLLPPRPGQFEDAPQATARSQAQRRLWNFVWLRRGVYFLTIAATIHLVAFPFIHRLRPTHEFDTYIKLVSEAVRAIASLLPNALHWWMDRYATNPEWLVAGIVAAIVFSAAGSSLSGRISDAMRIVWRSRGADDPTPRNATQETISSIRANPAYVAAVRLMRREVLPFVFFLFVILFVASFGSHLVVNLADSAGAFCRGDEAKAVLVDKGVEQVSPHEFSTKEVCAPLGFKVRAGLTYQIKITVTEDWLDRTWPTTPKGFHTADRDWPATWIHYSALPLRRVLFRPWLYVIGRIGETGVDEFFLDPVNRIEKITDPTTKVVTRVRTKEWIAKFQANRDGEMFLYVNDAVIGLPYVYSHFYDNNFGKARVSMTLL